MKRMVNLRKHANTQTHKHTNLSGGKIHPISGQAPRRRNWPGLSKALVTTAIARDRRRVAVILRIILWGKEM